MKTMTHSLFVCALAAMNTAYAASLNEQTNTPWNARYSITSIAATNTLPKRKAAHPTRRTPLSILDDLETTNPVIPRLNRRGSITDISRIPLDQPADVLARNAEMYQLQYTLRAAGMAQKNGGLMKGIRLLETELPTYKQKSIRVQIYSRLGA